MTSKPRIGLLGFLLVGLLSMSPLFALADDQSNDATTGSLKHEIDDLNSQVKDKESRVTELDGMINKYKNRIAEHEAAVASLQNEAALLENRVGEKNLAVERTKNLIELASLEIQNVTNQIQVDALGIERRQDALSELVRRIQEADGITDLDVFLSRPSLSDFFSRLGELKHVEQELANATHDLKQSKEQLESRNKELEADRLTLQNQKKQLQADQLALEGDRSAKLSLVSETQNSESEFQRILYELRQEQQSTASNIVDLQDKLKDRLDSVDTSLARGDVLLNWPIPVLRGISAFFHDPTYPFRRLFEHPGIDIPTDVGTPIRAAAGGYVAWNKQGRQYGNYVMLIHPGGIATVYAHLSRFAAKPDTYVERGDIIGYSGGHPGDEGAGLSTGAHLHFEVRQNGIPVNPMQFLASLE